MEAKNEVKADKTLLSSYRPDSQARPRINLDGNWSFRIDPDDVGVQEEWFKPAVNFSDTIAAPGSWDAQGIGKETEKVFANYVGKAWYRRSIKIPKSWRDKHIFLYIGGVHRYADIWVNGIHVCRHAGYVDDFEIDLTKHLSADKKAVIAIRVDNKQNWDIDALTGAFDLIDYMFVSWGGIYQHVWLEARDNVWIKDAFVKPHVSDSTVDVEFNIHSATDCSRKLIAEIVDQNNNIAAKEIRQLHFNNGGLKSHLKLTLNSPLLWSPNHPWLYRLRLSLYDGGKCTDQWVTRFGMREIEIRGADIYLNGKKIYLHGCGDDTVYPKTLCPPAEHEIYRKRLTLLKKFGFNYVRHHSSVPLPEYFDVADELGILIQPELPVAYENFLKKGLEHKASKELYFQTWRSMIRRYRNHPSVFGWCMGNEMYEGSPIADDLYKTAKSLDPTRPVYDSDGVGPCTDRPTLDVLTLQFDVQILPVISRAAKAIAQRPPMHPLLKPVTVRSEKFLLSPPPSKPVISHEMGNYVTYPDLREAEKFTQAVKPFWFKTAVETLKKRGIYDQAKQFAENSVKLQALCHKINIERQRLSPYTDGHALWLFQDYWTTNSGLVNTYYEIKGAGPQWYNKFVADVILIADMRRYTFTAGEKITVPLFISDFGEKDIKHGKLSWRLQQDTLILDKGLLPEVTIAEKGLNSLGSVALTLPDLKQAKKLTLNVSLNSTAGVIKNDWNIWVFPRANGEDIPSAKNIAQSGLDYLSDEYPAIVSLKRGDIIPQNTDLLLADVMSKGVLAYLKNGGKVILTRAWPLFATESATFEPAWWKGEPKRDASAGTVIYDNPALQDFPHENWCDLQFFDLIDNRYVMLLDNIPGAEHPIIRAIDTYTSSRQKAYLAEWRVGKGALLVSTLNFNYNVIKFPETRRLLRSLIHYGLSAQFSPQASLPVKYAEGHIVDTSYRPNISAPAFKYYYYRGSWTDIPDYTVLTASDSGYVSQINLDDIRYTDKENYALLLYGYFNVKKNGNYSFYSASNDGSQLFVDNIKVVDNGGSHGLREKSGDIYLKAGIHLLEIRYFQRGGGQALQVSYEGPAIEKQTIQAVQRNTRNK